MKKQIRFLQFPYLAAVILTVASISQTFAQTFPPGFSQVKVSSVNYPTAMTFASDGRIFVCEKAGKVRIIKNGVMLPTPFASVTVNTQNERGIDGIALDPDFETNNYVYVFYTVGTDPVHNRLSRFTANGDVAINGSEKIILEFEPVVNSIHNGAGMAFGLDGKLYLAIGDDHISDNAQDMSTYKGKVLRINKDGSAPIDNPFSGSEVARRIWALGLRNPYTLAVQPGIGKIFVNDVGEGSWEEINDVTAPGKNFGWPVVEGNGNNPTYTNPVHTYAHWASGTDGGCAITGGTFFNPTVTNYPSEYTGKYFFIDYCGSWINYLVLGTPAIKKNFGTAAPNSRVVIKTGTDGNLYFFSLNTSSLYKIIYNPDMAPVITDPPDDVTVSAGQPASFSVSASGSVPMSYQWKKNTSPIGGATAATYTINATQKSDEGQYTVTITNSSGVVTSNAAKLMVTAFNAAPVVNITSPANGLKYRGGDIISFSATATDSEDGVLPASAYSWWVEFHHDMHMHPGPSIAPGITSGTFKIPNTGETSANVYYRLVVVVKDSKGLTDTAYTDIKPFTSNLNLASEPSGLLLTIDGQPKTTLFSTPVVSGIVQQIGVVTPQSMNGVTYSFDSWKHGGTANQDITNGDADKTYTAVYKPVPSGCSATGSITREYWANYNGTTIGGIPVSTAPTGTSSLTLFEGPVNSGDYYGSRIRGFICPPATGAYTFWIASDNNSELWLSTNDNPANKVKIASVSSYTKSREWTKLPEQKSALKNLVSGQKYYIEAIHREGNQGDNLSVGWQLPDGALERPIPGSRLSPYVQQVVQNKLPAVSITSPKNNESFSTPVNITISASASDSDGTIAKVEFFQGGTKLGEKTTAPYTFGWSGVTTGTYYLTAKATDNSGGATTSTTITVIVTSCETPRITPQGPTTFCNGGSVILQANLGDGTVYQWRKDGANISGATASTYSATTSGSYQIKTVQGSCIAWSAPVKVTVNSCRLESSNEVQSIQTPEEEEAMMVKVYPNPNNGAFTLEVSMYNFNKEMFKIEVVNTLGQVVYNQELTEVNSTLKQRIELSNSLPVGIYFLKISIGKRSENTRILLAK